MLLRSVNLSLWSPDHRYLKKLTIEVSRLRKRNMAVVIMFVDACVFAPLPSKFWTGNFAVEDDVADALW